MSSRRRLYPALFTFMMSAMMFHSDPLLGLIYAACSSLLLWMLIRNGWL